MKDMPNPIDKADAVWQVDTLVDTRRRRSPFLPSTDTVAVPLAPKKTEGEGERIPKDEARLAKAKEALQSVEKRLSLARAASEGDRVQGASHADTPDGKRRPTSDSLENEDMGLSPISTAEVLEEYVPQYNSLLQRVTVKSWPTRYTFYERFRRDALALFERTAEPCQREPFFSYTPQYSQLTKEQLRFYLYFRESIRRRQAIEADYSYILLLLYEIINLPDRIGKEEGRSLLLYVWQTYRERHPKLDRLLVEWLCDYCLLYRLSPPDELYRGALADVLSFASMKEFYVGNEEDSPSSYASALYAHSTAYRFRSSKYITEENRALFERHIRAACLYAFAKVEREEPSVFTPFGRPALVPVTVTRDAFNGALCAYNVKRRIEISYLSCSRSVELRYVVTDTVKYAENQVRWLLGIRSRFHTPHLSQTLKSAVDEYFAPLKREKKKEHRPPPVSEAYEELYEPKVSDFSVAYGSELEEKAWAITERLVEETTEEERRDIQAERNTQDIRDIQAERDTQDIQAERAIRDIGDTRPSSVPAPPTSPVPTLAPSVPPPICSVPSAPTRAVAEGPSPASSAEDAASTTAFIVSPTAPCDVPPLAVPDGEAMIREALALCLANDHRGFAALASQNRLLPDALCEAVNEAMFDSIGDVVLEPTEDGYRVVVDYLEEITQWMNR